MSQFKLPQLIPDGTYRIRSAVSSAASPLYMEFQDNGTFDVRPMNSAPTSDKQKWKITGNAAAGRANAYTITNVSSNYNLSFKQDVDATGNPIFRVKAFEDGSVWNIDARGDAFVIGWEGDEKVVDVAEAGTESWLILWDRNAQNQQSWILERAISLPAPQPGKIIICNLSATLVFEAKVTKYSGIPGASDAWWPLTANGGSHLWTRNVPEWMVVRVQGTPDTGLSTGYYISPGTVVDVYGILNPGINVRS